MWTDFLFKKMSPYFDQMTQIYYFDKKFSRVLTRKLSFSDWNNLNHFICTLYSAIRDGKAKFSGHLLS